MYKIILFLFLSFVSKCAFSCSLASGYQLFTIDTVQNDIKSKPQKPIIKVAEIYRGSEGEPSMCADAGIIKLEILNPEKHIGYIFKVIEGNDIDKIIPDEAISPFEGDRNIEFAWFDGATDKQEPLKLRIEVKAISNNGIESDANYFWVQDNGRL